ncbi:MAG TPA: hypothetical protein VGN63_20885 [Flavisolibacter sp.]|jgi:hypothetical protein|nr:hypothetical protein [Flavisolibacter sp.]
MKKIILVQANKLKTLRFRSKLHRKHTAAIDAVENSLHNNLAVAC